jgi:hypothetical protein
MRTKALLSGNDVCFFLFTDNCNAVAQFKWYTQDVEEDIVDLYRWGRADSMDVMMLRVDIDEEED